MGVGLRTRDVYLGTISIVDKVIGVVETSRTSIMGEEDRISWSHRKWKCLRKRQMEEGPAKEGLEKEGESSMLDAS